jgi:hypothetical protein
MVLQGEADIVPRVHMTYRATSDSEERTGLVSRYSSSTNWADISKGRFSIAQAPSGWSIVRYEFSPDRMSFVKDPQAVALATAGGIELLWVNGRDDVLTIFPVNTFPDRDDFLQPKYDQIQAISMEGFQVADPQSPEDVAMILEGLPSGFIKDPEYGLGLQKDFRFIIHAIEEIKTLTKLMVTERRPSSVEGDTYVLNYRDFEAVRKGINRIHNNAVNAAFVDKRILAHNALLTSLLPDTYPKKHSPYKKDTIFKAVLGAAEAPPSLSAADKDAVLTLVSNNRQDLAKSHPQELLELRREIELVTLEQLIDKLEKLIAKKQPEHHWQRLFLDNPFILSLAFGLPIVALGGQVSVGGRKFDGTGDRIADFLHCNGLTDNITLIEIKMPGTKLLSAEYRSGIFSPSPELAGTVNQVLDQRYQLQKSIAGLKDSSKRYDLESYAIKCVIMIGTTPTDADQKKSLELFRNNLNDVLVVTFDELLEKLKHLHAFLSPKQT